MNLKIEINEYNEYQAKITLSPAAAFLAYSRLIASPRFSLCDGEDPVEFERGLGGWSSFDFINSPDGFYGRGASVVIDEDESYVVFCGISIFEGDDRFDHTLVAKELSLPDRLAIAAMAREVLL